MRVAVGGTTRCPIAAGACLALGLLSVENAHASLVPAAKDTLGVPGREDHSPCLKKDPAGNLGLIWIATAPDTTPGGRFDEVVFSERSSGAWSSQTLAGPGNYYTPSVVWTPAGARWSTWCEHDGTDSRIHIRRDHGGSTQWFVLDDPGQPDVEPSICAARGDSVVVVWQGWRTDDYEILFATGDSTGLSPPQVISGCALNDREPRVVWGNDQAWMVWSTYEGEPYDLTCRRFDGAVLTPAVSLTASPRARNLHVDIAWDDFNDVLWLSWIRVNQGWNGFNNNEPGLYDLGSPRVLAFNGTQLLTPLGLNAFGQYPMKIMEDMGYQRYSAGGTTMPDRWGSGLRVVPDGAGRTWFFHKQLGSLTEFGAPNRYWGTVGTYYQASGWSAPDEVLDLRNSLGWEAPQAVAAGDTLWVAWTADRRSPTIASPGLNLFGHDLNVIVHGFPVANAGGQAASLTPAGSPGVPANPSLVPRPQFTVEENGQTLTMLWGDNHRHSCDVSWDAHSDPLLKQTLFYSLDWLGHDFICPSDHAERYGKAMWSWVPKFAMLYDIPGRFRVFAGYERSMRGGAGGDQNSLYRDPAQFTEASAAHPAISSWHTLYNAQAGIDVLSVPHTTAECGAVAKWNLLANGHPESLPAPLRLVEVYQSARESFEYPGCPRQFFGCVAPPDSGWVNLALGLGMRVGLISASDHTIRAAFLGVLAPDRSRDAIWQALWDRRTMGTGRTRKGNIEFRVAGALQGSEVESEIPPTLTIRADFDSALTLITVNKDGDPNWLVIPTLASDTTVTFVDPDPVVPGTSSYYYVRVTDLATRLYWTSPVWVDFTEPVLTGAPVSGDALTALRVDASPNPSSGRTELRLSGIAASGGLLRIYDVTGRLVRRLHLGSAQGRATWDGLDQEGKRAVAGMHFFVVESGGQRAVTKNVSLR